MADGKLESKKKIMKTLHCYLTELLILIASHIPAQSDFISSRVYVLKETGEAIPAENAHALIKLNTHNYEFTINSCLILTISDSVTDKSQQTSIDLNFTGPFPIDNLDFYDVVNDKNIHVINGELTVNEITHAYKVNFGLHSPTSRNVYTQGIPSYSAHINFAIEINPIDFNLDNIPASFAKTLIIRVKDGIINKTGENEIAPECIIGEK